jgi:hypothetical protein
MLVTALPSITFVIAPSQEVVEPSALNEDEAVTRVRDNAFRGSAEPAQEGQGDVAKLDRTSFIQHHFASPLPASVSPA